MATEREKIEKSIMLKQNRRNLIQYARKKEAAELTEAIVLLQREQTTPRTHRETTSCAATPVRGETAWAVLRFHKQPAQATIKAE